MEKEKAKETAKGAVRLMLELYSVLLEHPLDTGKYKISSLSFSILFRLYRAQEHRIGIPELAREMQISKPQLSKLLNRLEEEGLLLRERFRINRRVVYITLTPDGEAYLNHAAASLADSLTEILIPYEGEKIEAFAEGIERLEQTFLSES